MTDIILQYTKEIFIISVLSEIFISLIRSGQYKSYAGYISGLVTILICVKMFFSILNVNVTDSAVLYFKNSLKLNDAYISEMLTISDDAAYVNSYIDANIEYIEELAAGYGLSVADISINADDYGITTIEVLVEQQYADECMELKVKLADIYGIDSSNISVYWRN